jgi:hypothetical protein
MSPDGFEDLDEEEQFFDPNLILPNGVSRQAALDEFRKRNQHLNASFVQPSMINASPTLTTSGNPAHFAGTYTYPSGIGVSPLTISPTDLSLSSASSGLHLNSLAEELDYGKVLQDSDVEPLLDTEFLQDVSVGDDYQELEGWGDYILDVNGFPDEAQDEGERDPWGAEEEAEADEEEEEAA